VGIALKQPWVLKMLNLSLSCSHRCHQLFHTKDVERPAQIVDERRQAELGPDLFEALLRIPTNSPVYTEMISPTVPI
jgi:hypothetical protein